MQIDLAIEKTFRSEPTWSYDESLYEILLQFSKAIWTINVLDNFVFLGSD